MEISLRQWVREQVGVDLAHVEQLYTFADQGRYRSGESDERHVVSVGYLALARAEDAGGGAWDNLYRHFPWEDWRIGRPDVLDAVILPALDSGWGGMTMPLNVCGWPSAAMKHNGMRSLCWSAMNCFIRPVLLKRQSATGASHRRRKRHWVRHASLTIGAFWPPLCGASAAN